MIMSMTELGKSVSESLGRISLSLTDFCEQIILSHPSVQEQMQRVCLILINYWSRQYKANDYNKQYTYIYKISSEIDDFIESKYPANKDTK